MGDKNESAELLSPGSPTAKDRVLPGSKKPEDTAFKQQRLPAWQPIMSPPWVIGCFFVCAAIFIPIGSAIIVTSDNIEEIEIRYDHHQSCGWEKRAGDPNNNNYACQPLELDFNLQKRMKGPVFIYYKLENFYQNHRLYAKSQSAPQLSGGEPNTESKRDCEPFRSPGEYGTLSTDAAKTNVTGTQFNWDDILYNPCGLVAWSKFNDTLKLRRANVSTGLYTLICDGGAFDIYGRTFPGRPAGFCVKRGIAWPSDPGVRYKESKTDMSVPTLTSFGWPNADPTQPYAQDLLNGWYIGEEGHKLPNAADEDLMVWMRLASLSTFRKLYRRVTIDLEPGRYRLEVEQRYDVRSFKGKKSFVLTTASWIGGKNYFLGGLYIATGCLCLILACGFLVKHIRTPSKLVTV